MSVRRALARLGFPLLPAALGVTFFSASGRDDPYITYWPAHALATWGQLVNYNGARIEQSTSLLHTVVLAGLSRLLPVSMPTLGFVVGLLGAGAAVVLAQAVARSVDGRARWLAAALSATAVYFVYWTVGSLETTLVAACLLAVVVAMGRVWRDGLGRTSVAWLGVAVALYVAVRPENAMILAAALVGVAVVRVVWRTVERRAVALGDLVDDELRALLVALGLTAAAFVVVTAFRLVYFDSVFPNPVSAKVEGRLDVDTVRGGINYARNTVSPFHMLALCALLALAFVRTVRRPPPVVVLLWSLLAVNSAAVITSGGDWMEGGRLLVPAVVVATVLAAIGLTGLHYGGVVGVAVVVVQLVGVVHFARHDSTGKPVWASITSDAPAAARSAVDKAPWPERANRVHYRDLTFIPALEAVVERLTSAGKISMASGQAGQVTYEIMREHYGDVVFIDLYGLSTKSFEHCSAGLEKSFAGAHMPVRYWFRHLEECRVPPPEIIFDIYGSEKPMDVPAGYTVVYRQSVAEVRGSARYLPGGRVDGGEYIAIRDDKVALARAAIPGGG